MHYLRSRSSDRKGRLLIVGNTDIIHMGAHMRRAARSLNVTTEICDTRAAFDTNWLVLQLNWRLRGHRPPLLGSFSRRVLSVCETFRPTWMLTIGFAPIEASVVQQIRTMGSICLNYATDDPWNPGRRGDWFFQALPEYDWIFSPRRANLSDLDRLGCRNVVYLPFAYAPDLHYPDPPRTINEREHYNSDVVFYGGADRDRLPYITALVQSEFEVQLYGDYWERFPETRRHTRGHAKPGTLRKAVGGAKVNLCLIRRANRDGHVMRSYEVPAMGGCMLAEDTPEHRAIFSGNGKAVMYFSTIDEMLSKLSWLLQHDEERRRLAIRAHEHITESNNTYQARLQTMLNYTAASTVAEQ